MAYYTLLRRENEQSPWEIEFGDYDKTTVESEREIFLYGGDWQNFKRKNLKIIKTNSARQAEINKAVLTLNSATA